MPLAVVLRTDRGTSTGENKNTGTKREMNTSAYYTAPRKENSCTEQ